MARGERATRIQNALREQQLDLLVCALPINVLMMSGYAPVVGTGVCIAFSDGAIRLLIPEDESDLSQRGWADEARYFAPSSLRSVNTVTEAIAKPLAAMASGTLRIGYEAGECSQPAAYSGFHSYGGSMKNLLGECFPHASLMPVDDCLAGLRANKTSLEVDRIRTACKIAGEAFAKGRAELKTGATETGVASTFREPLSSGASNVPGVQRADGFAWCMSGANSALAAAAYARSREKKIDRGDLVLVHCNSYADGYWTDITRTYCAGPPDQRQAALYHAVFEARAAALAAIRPGARAAAVDEGARAVMRAHGLGAAFKHSSGHGVGFEAITPAALPRIHPESPDVLAHGMVFNIEPAAYFEGYGGIRHCDVVAVTDRAYEVLTPFQCDAEEILKGV